ncbi:glycosyltransferase family 2 protein [Phormidium sp. CCY1219]|uniref:glycosyltransferase family 2 protein n=1 Tax=Phormidium sp. CCY1219 TaxID=2886104 RepID=UPI002D1F13B0|nr:hypothetical protein [Phormidium sp. CCY1219]MEB3826063.1 hypothetical protein [Phormidium sp. CCY1219]
MSSQPQTISLLCPSWGRPEKALRLCLSALNTAAKPKRVEMLFYVDEDDPKQAEYLNLFKAHKREFDAFRRCGFIIGEAIGISKAWNELARRCDGNLLIMSADDQTYNDFGWDDRLDVETQAYPDEIFCMWFNEGHWGGQLCTFPIVSRKWCQTLGYFTTGLFECLYDDMWIWELAKRVGRLHYIPDILTEHLHWGYGKAAIDATYAKKQVTRDRQLKPAVYRDMDLYCRTIPYRETDARRLAAVMEGEVKLQPVDCMVPGKSSIFDRREPR